MAEPLGMDIIAGIARQYLTAGYADAVHSYAGIATDTPTAWAPRRARMTPLPEPDPLDELMTAAGCTPPPVNTATLQDADYADQMRAHVGARWADAVADRGDDDDEADLVRATMADSPARAPSWTWHVRDVAAPPATTATFAPADLDPAVWITADRAVFHLSPSDACQRIGLNYAASLWSLHAVTPPTPRSILLGGMA